MLGSGATIAMAAGEVSPEIRDGFTASPRSGEFTDRGICIVHDKKVRAILRNARWDVKPRDQRGVYRSP